MSYPSRLYLLQPTVILDRPIVFTNLKALHGKLPPFKFHSSSNEVNYMALYRYFKKYDFATIWFMAEMSQMYYLYKVDVNHVIKTDQDFNPVEKPSRKALF